jgi:hypothetical protein
MWEKDSELAGCVKTGLEDWRIVRGVLFASSSGATIVLGFARTTHA